MGAKSTRNWFRAVSFLLLISACTGLAAQTQVRLLGPEAVIDKYRLDKIPEATEAMTAAGLSAEAQHLVHHFNGPVLRPEGIATAAAREANAAYLGNYVLFKVCEFDTEAGERVLALMPFRDNLHMPDDLRPVNDIYLLLDKARLEPTGTGRPPPPFTRGPDHRELRPMRILKPAELYATYRLEYDTEGLDVLKAIGLGQDQIEVVAYRSHERQWPAGIANFDDRYARIKRFRKYRVKELARWDDKVLLVAPAQRNQCRPKAMRPAVDLYFIYAQDAVEPR